MKTNKYYIDGCDAYVWCSNGYCIYIGNNTMYGDIKLNFFGTDIPKGMIEIPAWAAKKIIGNLERFNAITNAHMESSYNE